MKEKDEEILILKKKLNIPKTQHVQSTELLALQHEKDQIQNEMIECKEQLKLCRKTINTLKQEKEELLKEKLDLVVSRISKGPDQSLESLSKAMAEMSIKDTKTNSLKDKLNEKESELVTLKEVADLKDVMV